MSLTKNIQAFDIDGNELAYGDIVEIVEGNDSHHWLRKGNTLRVAYWSDRSFGKEKYIVVFLGSKKGGRLCQLGLHEKCLRKVSGI